MEAVIFDEVLKYDNNYPEPKVKEGEALIKVEVVGICNTDYEITKGYMGYRGVLGHEFVGVVEKINDLDQSLLGKRVVGEINLGCNKCKWCTEGLSRHCPNRQTLGIYNKDGCFAKYVTLPKENLYEVPYNVTNNEAVFTEPLAASLEILEQLHIAPDKKVCVLGDGKLGLITSLALNACNIDVVLIGKHENKLSIAKEQGVRVLNINNINEIKEKSFDVVVEATGNVSGFETSLKLVKPRGVLVLKSTIATGKELNLASVVVDEITILGSRCGQFGGALRLLESKKINFDPLISDILPFKDALLGFEKNKQSDVLKILLKL